MAYTVFLLLANLVVFYLISWVVGSLYTYLRYHEILKGEAYKKKKYTAMRWVCWGFLIIFGVLKRQFEGILLYAGVFLLIELVCFCAKKASHWQKPDLDKLTDYARQVHRSASHLIAERSEPSQEQALKTSSYDMDEYLKFVGDVYDKIKQTHIFKFWKKEQFDCQFGKCAICGKPMLGNRYSEVIHLRLRRKIGANYSDNLALAHKECSEDRKPNLGFDRPSWVKQNKYDEELNNEAYSMTEKARKDYPTKFPEEMFVKPSEVQLRVKQNEL